MPLKIVYEALPQNKKQISFNLRLCQRLKDEILTTF